MKKVLIWVLALLLICGGMLVSCDPNDPPADDQPTVTDPDNNPDENPDENPDDGDNTDTPDDGDDSDISSGEDQDGDNYGDYHPFV